MTELVPLSEPVATITKNTIDLTGMSKKEIFLMRPPNNTIILNYGPIPGRQPTIFFSYPTFLKM